MIGGSLPPVISPWIRRIAVEPSRVTSTVVSVIGLPPRGRMPPAWRSAIVR